MEGVGERVVVGRGRGKRRPSCRDQVAQCRLVLRERGEDGPAVLHETEDGSMLDVEHAREVGGAGNERR